MAKPEFIQCMSCGHQQPYESLEATVCRACGGLWLEPGYEYEVFRQRVMGGLEGKPYNIWRYSEVLPVANLPQGYRAHIGWTPLLRSGRFAGEMGCSQVFIKDERYGPTGSFKDRHAAVMVAAMQEEGIKECVIASTGNTGVAYAAACAAAGIKLWVFMTGQVSNEKLREVALFGAEVVKVSGSYDQTRQIAAEFARSKSLFYDRGVTNIAAREAMKTIAYEIVEQLGWRAPDWYIQSMSGGLGPMGVAHGFRELFEMGLIEKIPAIGLIQIDGCAPMARAFKAGEAVAAPVTAKTRIAVLSTGNPGGVYPHLRRYIQQHGGAMESVSEAAVVETMQKLACLDGLAVEPAAAVAFAGLGALVEQRTIPKDAVVVVNCSGHTFPVEKYVLGEDWEVELEIGEEAMPAPGLRNALRHLDERTTTVLIIDDNPDDALLIRRFLETKKSYRVYHVADGRQGLAEAKNRKPDLIILDLTMPEMDGFTVLEELKIGRNTRHIPVIVVSAKDISSADRERLNGNIEALYQKGSLPVQTFINQVVEVIEQKGNANREGK